MWMSVFFDFLQDRYLNKVLFDKRVHFSESLKLSLDPFFGVYVCKITYRKLKLFDNEIHCRSVTFSGFLDLKLVKIFKLFLEENS